MIAERIAKGSERSIGTEELLHVGLAIVVTGLHLGLRGDGYVHDRRCDAGGKGLTLLIDAFLEVVDGRPIPEPELVDTPARVAKHLAGDDVSTLRYEVMYLLDADDDTMPAFREAWASIGDSIVVVGGDGIWNCHVHTNDIGAAVEAGIDSWRRVVAAAISAPAFRP